MIDTIKFANLCNEFRLVVGSVAPGQQVEMTVPPRAFDDLVLSVPAPLLDKPYPFLGSEQMMFCGVLIRRASTEPRSKEVSVAEVLGDLAKVRAIFQQRAITAAMGITPNQVGLNLEKEED